MTAATPRAPAPLTPAMSGESVDGDRCEVDVPDSSFSLPPAALSPGGGSTQRPRRAAPKSFKPSYVPVSPTSPNPMELDLGSGIPAVAHAGTKRTLDEFNLPPPPTRARKIIQMKPKIEKSQSKNGSSSPPSASAKSQKDVNKTSAASSSGTKKKQANATTAAGRKHARKTAHSLIERRRRSKMNEEFNTLKNMIPACRGQEMHKLAILQASIDYVRYLEQCIVELKAATSRTNAREPPSPTSPDIMLRGKSGSDNPAASESLELSAGSEHCSPVMFPHDSSYSRSQRGSADGCPSALSSPNLPPSRSSSSSSSSHQFIWQATKPPSSASKPPPNYGGHRHSISSAIEGDTDADHEVSAALLMLNRDPRGSIDWQKTSRTGETAPSTNEESELTDRRGKLGLSVKDLLS